MICSKCGNECNAMSGADLSGWTSKAISMCCSADLVNEMQGCNHYGQITSGTTGLENTNTTIGSPRESEGNFMENCKLVNSQSVKRKVDILNPDMSYNNGGWYDAHPFIIIENGNCYSVEKHYTYNNIDLPEITQKDFLALPEPLVVGEWVCVVNEGYILFGKLKKYDVELGEFNLEGSEPDYFMYQHVITKLTQQQIDILGLNK